MLAEPDRCPKSFPALERRLRFGIFSMWAPNSDGRRAQRAAENGESRFPPLSFED